VVAIVVHDCVEVVLGGIPAAEDREVDLTVVIAGECSLDVEDATGLCRQAVVGLDECDCAVDGIRLELDVVAHPVKVGVGDDTVLRCARCGARREVLAVVMRPQPVRAILTHLDLVGVQGAPRPPPPGQLSLI
jgi:hypothetical protein